MWGGIVPGNLGELNELAERGVVGFKAFLCNSGLPEFPRADDLTLYEGMRVAAACGLPVAVHAESEEITADSPAASAIPARATCALPGLRPVIAEVEAIQRAALLAREAGAWLHIVHISSGRGVLPPCEARARGTDVTIETCPHYLFFTDEDMVRLGAVAKCAPPLRPADGVGRALWQHVLHGDVDMIASDHSPSSPDLKCDRDFFARRGAASPACNPARRPARCRPSRARSAARRDRALTAELPPTASASPGKAPSPQATTPTSFWSISAESSTLAAEDLHQRHTTVPYTGHHFRGAVRRTLLRGQTIFRDGASIDATIDRPLRSPSNSGD